MNCFTFIDERNITDRSATLATSISYISIGLGKLATSTFTKLIDGLNFLTRKNFMQKNEHERIFSIHSVHRTYKKGDGLSFTCFLLGDYKS